MWSMFISRRLALSAMSLRKTLSRRAPFRRPPYRLRLEALEERCVPTAGALDPTFGNGGFVQTPALQGSTDDEAERAFSLPNGQLMVVGITLTQQPSDYAVTLSRYNSDGTLDTTYGNGTGRVVTGLTSQYYPSGMQFDNNVFCQPDGSIIIGWGTVLVNNSAWQLNELTRYLPNGNLDTAFGTDGVVNLTGFTNSTVTVFSREV
jgi:uncharacterized delta-60 repeat protein